MAAAVLAAGDAARYWLAEHPATPPDKPGLLTKISLRSKIDCLK
jgi:hypothetical protein